MHVHDVTADWADLSAVPEAMSSWAHNGITVTDAGELIGFHAGQLVAFDRNGHVSRSVRPGLKQSSRQIGVVTNRACLASFLLREHLPGRSEKRAAAGAELLLNPSGEAQ